MGCVIPPFQTPNSRQSVNSVSAKLLAPISSTCFAKPMTTGAPTIAPLQSLKRQPEYSTTVTTNNLVRIFHRNSHPCFHKTSQSQRPAKFNRAHTRAQLSVQSTVNLAIRLALLLPALVLLPGCIVLFPLPIVVT